jgi:hypothetical protein
VKSMTKWWDRKWQLVIAAILLPTFVVPAISVFLFPETPITETILYGAVCSLFVALAFRTLQQIELLGLRVFILMTVGATLLSLFLLFLFRTG